MAQFGFSRENSRVKSGANTEASLKAGQQPFAGTTDGNEPWKRNVVATTAGWVRRTNRGTVNGQRTHDEILIAGSPGREYGGGSVAFTYVANTNLGPADISEIYVKLNANNVISANVSANLYVVFNQPVHFKASGNSFHLQLSNTAGGNHGRAVFATGNRANGANNILVFVMPKLQGRAGSLKATYHINAAAKFFGPTTGVAVVGMPLYNPEIGITAAANTTITGAVANGLNNGFGTRITNFTVSPKGV
jgi:hypothetical protein